MTETEKNLTYMEVRSKIAHQQYKIDRSRYLFWMRLLDYMQIKWIANTKEEIHGLLVQHQKILVTAGKQVQIIKDQAHTDVFSNEVIMLPVQHSVFLKLNNL